MITLETQETQKQPRLSDDLTVVLLRGNGSPRTFRLSLPALQRSLTTLGFFFAIAVVAAVLLLVLNIFRFSTDHTQHSAAAPSAPTSSSKASEENDPRKEIEDLRADITRLNAIANSRKDLAVGSNPGLIQFFGPASVMQPNESLQVKNVKVVHGGKDDLYVDFELHNVNEEPKPIRGYIVVLAKTPSQLLAYPEGVFSTAQNIVLDFTKGETFGVTRFRQVRAQFPGLAGKKAKFEALLFANDGTVLADLHVEDKQ